MNQTLPVEPLTNASYRVFRDKKSKVIKGVISGLKAKNCEKYSKNHCLYKLHSRVTSLAHIHCYQPGSSGCSQFWDQNSWKGHFRSKIKNLQKCSNFFISKSKHSRVTWPSYMYHWYLMCARYFYFWGQRSFKGHFRF